MRTARFSRRLLWPSTRPNLAPSAPISTRHQPSAPSPQVRQPGHTEPRAQAKTEDPATRKKTIAEIDAELQSRLEAMSGDGGAAGVEYEDGSAEGLKKQVKQNMFRLI